MVAAGPCGMPWESPLHLRFSRGSFSRSLLPGTLVSRAGALVPTRQGGEDGSWVLLAWAEQPCWSMKCNEQLFKS